jgi:signal transduction histidine kinase/ActR/RegA family two-component response regulator
MDTRELKDAYSLVLKAYSQTEEEQYLVEASELGRACMRTGVPPEEIAEIHEEAIGAFAEEFSDKTLVAMARRISAPLMEMLMAYGLAFRQQDDERQQAEAQREELEAQLRQAHKMESIGQLAGGVAHDFNNLLTVIGGYAQYLARSIQEPDPRRAHVQQIITASDKAAALVGQLLAFSRRQELRPEILDLNRIVRDSEAMLRRLISEQVQLETELDPRLPPVCVDAGQMVQVLMNLAVNARDAMPGGGTIRVRTEAAALDAPRSAYEGPIPPGRYVRLGFADTGEGIAADVIDRIFDPFYSTKEVGKGTGLGLSTVYGIISQSHGYIVVDSQPGAGTTFSIYLPLADATVAPPASAMAPDAQAARGSEAILVVEDDGMLRVLTQQALVDEGYRVLVAGNGDAALRLLADGAEDIDLLVTDVVMPGMSGPELAREVRSRYGRIRILFMSGYGDDAVVGPHATSKLEPLLRKPFDLDELARQVRTLLDQEDDQAQ